MLVLYACTEKKIVQSGDKLLINYADCIKKTMSEIPDSILGQREFILLDNNNRDCFVSMITKVAFENNCLYVFDPKLLRIVAFDRNGKGIGHVGDRGQGYNEYVNISDFCLLDNGDIYFIDGTLDKLFIFDKELKFKNSIELPFEAEMFHILNNGNILWGLCSWNDKKCSGMKIAQTDQDLHIVDSVIEYGEDFDPNYQFSFNKFVETADCIAYNQTIDNNIYLFDKNGKMRQTITMDFGNANVPSKHKSNIEANLKDFENYCLLKSYVVVTENIIAGQLRKYGKTVPFIYDRMNNISYEGLPSEVPTYTTATGYNNSQWITYLEPTEEQDSNLPDSVNIHLNHEGMVLCFQTLK